MVVTQASVRIHRMTTQEELFIQTQHRGFYDISADVKGRVAARRLDVGLLTLFIPHTSASLIIQENADPAVLHDLENFFTKLVPDGDPGYEHRSEGPDDMPAHIRSALTQTHLSIPISSGRLCLGTWQGIYLYEHRTDPHQRRVILHFSDS